METELENINLSEEEKLKRVKVAKGGSWYSDAWTPYCLTCSKMPRMNKRNYGFECPYCNNMIGWNLTRLKESPLNR